MKKGSDERANRDRSNSVGLAFFSQRKQKLEALEVRCLEKEGVRMCKVARNTYIPTQKSIYTQQPLCMYPKAYVYTDKTLELEHA